MEPTGRKLLFYYGAADFAFALTGGVILAFAVLGEQAIRGEPKTETVAQALLLSRCPLIAAMVNAILIFVAFLLSFPAAFLTSNRGWLKAQGWAVVVSSTFTLILGLIIWYDTLKTRANLAGSWATQSTQVQSLLQQRFNCCGYVDADTPIFVADSTCPNLATASLKQGCMWPLSAFANSYLDVIFTAAFGVVAIDILLLLGIVMLIRRREEIIRYRHIDDKIVLGGF